LKHAVLAVAVAAAVVMGCGAPPEDTTPAVVYPPCGPLIVAPPTSASPLQRNAVLAGLELWNRQGFTQLGAAGDGQPIALHFQKASPIFNGFYDPKTGEVLINESMDEPGEIAVVVAHELGHAMGLAHVEQNERASVMNPGNLSVTPTPADSALLSSSCASQP
jgi:hypothetical protein